MKFIDLLDVTQLMRRIAETMDEENPFYTDFKFFSAINYTTQSEYRQELKKLARVDELSSFYFISKKAKQALAANEKMAYKNVEGVKTLRREPDI